ncbi:MAG: molybdopterin-binding protein [Nitrososphaerota archaeon]|nr:molybdopterin-binding protein [Nitrososphaerota archaeon]MDG6930623.1 molybdopterin-binding protein [Nitrososphaerota archaeon]MDG6932752.1 molybdopterin-binding protein [Nitrososphaerota archaeon]MDG6935859.1 molybdopterin-binding protein [Nitrososphaerota archaeon]MDG6944180.1 molybdopterin-binding protein [Nitrososphaerota archaeon]
MVTAVPVELAVGKELAYDTTIVNGEKAGVLLERGHIISRDDVELLKKSGLFRVYIMDEQSTDAFESEIAGKVAMASVDPASVEIRAGKQGSSLLFSRFPGIISVSVDELKKINMSGIALLITRRAYEAVGSGELVGVIDSLPLYIKRERLDSLSISKALSVKPFSRKNVGLVVTGTEVYKGIKDDLYTEVVREKANKYGWNIIFRKLVPDDLAQIAGAIREARNAGSEAIIVTGGMSVDPTDITPSAIGSLGSTIVSYGIPLKPTTMSLVAYWDGIPVFGISAGGIYYRDLNSIDVVFTLLMAGMELTPEWLAMLGNGGLLPNFNPAFKLH